MPGPKPTLTKDKARAVLSHLEAGVSLTKACDTVAIGVSSYYRHIEGYPDILEEIKSVLDAQKHSRREQAVETIFDAFKKDWKAAAWWLERNYPHEFGRHQPRTAPVIALGRYVVQLLQPIS